MASNLRDTAKAVLKGKFIAWNVHNRRKDRSGIKYGDVRGETEASS